MLKKIVGSIVITSIMISLSGCIGAGDIEVKPMSSTPLSERTALLNLNFPKLDPVTGEKVILNLSQFNFSQNLLDLSKYKAFHRTETSNDGTIDYFKGIRVSDNGNTYVLDYSNGEYYRNNVEPLPSSFTTSALFTINTQKINENQISFTLADKYTYQPCNNILGLSVDSLDKLQNLESDARNIVSKLRNITLTIHNRFHLTGTINSKYNTNSIYANFKRLVGSYNWNTYYNSTGKEKLTEVKKENSFNLKVGSKQLPLQVEVYPYHNGSKVQYEAYIPYTLNSKGVSTLAKQDIETIQAQIAKIVND